MYTTEKSKKSKRKFFIPQFYECDLTILGKENIRIVNGYEGISVYVTPLIRTILNDISSYNLKGQESLGRHIKEKMDSNSRLLIKKSMERSPITFICNKQYVLLDCDITMISSTKFHIKNNLNKR